MKRKAGVILLCVVLAAGILAGCSKGGEKKIIVGSKGFTENLILSELYALALEDLGYQVERKFDISNAIIHTAIENAEIDLYPEYSGTSLITILGMDMMTDPETVYRSVKDAYMTQYGLTVLDMCRANDGNGLAIRTDVVEEYGIYTISDLQEHADKVRFGSTSDFAEREDGYLALEKTYGSFDFISFTAFDNALKYVIMENDEVDCVPAYTTDPQLSLDMFTLLEDDKTIWPPYNVIPVIRTELAEDDKKIAEAINYISSCLDTPTLTQLNAKVDLEKLEYDEVARDFYEGIKR